MFHPTFVICYNSILDDYPHFVTCFTLFSYFTALFQNIMFHPSLVIPYNSILSPCFRNFLIIPPFRNMYHPTFVICYSAMLNDIGTIKNYPHFVTCFTLFSLFTGHLHFVTCFTEFLIFDTTSISLNKVLSELTLIL